MRLFLMKRGRAVARLPPLLVVEKFGFIRIVVAPAAASLLLRLPMAIYFLR